MQNEYTQMNELTDDDELFLIKEAIEKKLTKVQRKIYLTYVDEGTYSATAKAFNCSIPTISKYIKRINGLIAQYVFDNI